MLLLAGPHCLATAIRTAQPVRAQDLLPIASRIHAAIRFAIRRFSPARKLAADSPPSAHCTGSLVEGGRTNAAVPKLRLAIRRSGRQGIRNPRAAFHARSSSSSETACASGGGANGGMGVTSAAGGLTKPGGCGSGRRPNAVWLFTATSKKGAAQRSTAFLREALIRADRQLRRLRRPASARPCRVHRRWRRCCAGRLS